MKLRKLLILFPSLVALAACGNTPSPTPDNNGNSGNRAISDTFKEIGEDMAYYAASKSKPANRALQDMSVYDKKIELVMPSTLLYLVGKLYENNGFDCKDKIVAFNADFDITYGSSMTQEMQLTLSLMINIDETNNIIKFNGFQDSLQGSGSSMMVVKSHLYLEIDYNFATKELGDFKMWGKGQNGPQGSSSLNTSFTYSQCIGGQAKKIDMNNKDEYYLAREAEIDAVIQDFKVKEETKTVADAQTARTYAEGYIATQNFINEIVDQDLQISFHNQ